MLINKGDQMEKFRQQEWMATIRQFEMERAHIRSLMELPFQRIIGEFDERSGLQETLRLAQGLDAFDRERQLQVRSEQWNQLRDLLWTERARSLLAELDLAKQTHLQYEQLRLSSEFLGWQRTSDLLAGQQELKHLTRSVALDVLGEIQERYNSVYRLAELPSLPAITKAAIRAMNIAYIDQYFSQTFAGSILQSLSHLQRSHRYEDFETNLEILERLFEKRIQTITPGVISFEAILGVFVDILLFIIEIIMSNQSENRIVQEFTETKRVVERHVDSKQDEMMKEFEEFKNKVFDSLDKLQVKQDWPKTFYVATRIVNVRSGASQKSPVIAKIHKNQRVALIDSKDEWIYIEYFDYIDGIPKMGWVYSKYLKHLSDQGK